MSGDRATELVVEAGRVRMRSDPRPWLLLLYVPWLLFATQRAFPVVVLLPLIPMLALLWRRRGALAATREGLTFRGRRFAPWSRITALAPAGPTGLVVRRRDLLLPRSYWIELESPEGARRVLDLATARVRRTEIDGGSLLESPGGIALAFVGTIAAAVSSVQLPHATAMAVIAAMGVALTLLSMVRTTITLGTDGIHVRGPFRRRVVRADRIAGCTLKNSHRLDVTLDDDSVVKLRVPFVGSTGTSIEAAHAFTLEIGRRILALRGAAAELSEAQRGVLRRGNRALGDWLALLRAPAHGGHRGALPRALLWQIIESPGDEEQRAAALAALAGTLAPEERVRVAELGGGTSSPRLRVVADAVLAGDETKVERALLAVRATPR